METLVHYAEVAISVLHALGLISELGGLVGLVIWLLPTFLSLLRRKRNTGSVALLNVFLSWTIFGWGLALVVAVSNENRSLPAILMDTFAGNRTSVAPQSAATSVALIDHTPASDAEMFPWHHR